MVRLTVHMFALTVQEDAHKILKKCFMERLK